MSRAEIEAAIPHRPPMLLIDEIVEQTDTHIHCRKQFHAKEFFFQGHYPDHPIVPGVILCEAAMQAGAILLSKAMHDQTGVPVATRLNNAKFKKMIQPGDTIDIAIELTERVANAFFLQAKVTCDNKVAVRFEFACTLAAAE